MTTPVLLDTSAILALLDADDGFHTEARRVWDRLLEGMRRRQRSLVVHHAMVVESSALVQRRLGMRALREMHASLLPLAEIAWIDEGLHRRATAAMFASARREVSLVDWLSFELMRARRIRHAFTFDTHFRETGLRAGVERALARFPESPGAAAPIQHANDHHDPRRAGAPAGRGLPNGRHPPRRSGSARHRAVSGRAQVPPGQGGVLRNLARPPGGRSCMPAAPAAGVVPSAHPARYRRPRGLTGRQPGGPR